jgi:hypothetical protein
MNCSECRFWSDKLAQANGGRGVEAYCLSSDGPHKHTYTSGRQLCEKWQDAPMGSVDSGSDDDPRYGNPYLDFPEVEPSEADQGLIPIPDAYNEA